MHRWMNFVFNLGVKRAIIVEEGLIEKGFLTFFWEKKNLLINSYRSLVLYKIGFSKRIKLSAPQNLFFSQKEMKRMEKTKVFFHESPNYVLYPSPL